MSREMAVSITAVASTLGFIISSLSDTSALIGNQQDGPAEF